MQRCNKRKNRCVQGSVKEFGYRITLPRKTIMKVLESTKEHLSVEEIFKKVYEQIPSVGLTTVYRTLDLLVQMGFVVKCDFGDGRARYELAEDFSGKPHHHHLVCTECSAVFDYTDFIDEEKKLLTTTKEKLEKKFNFCITSHFIQFYGQCKECFGKV